MRKRALSLLLTLAFCLTMLPTAALAEGTDTQTGTGDTVYTVNADTAVQSTEDGAADTVGNAVAEVTIGDQTTPYDTLANAFAAAQENSGSTVKLLSDCSSNNSYTFENMTATLDLNGHTVESVMLNLSNNTNLTIKNTGENKSAYFENVYIWDNGSLTVENGAYVINIYVKEPTARLALNEGAKLNYLALDSSGLRIADILPTGCYIVNSSTGEILSGTGTGANSMNPNIVKKIQGTVTAPENRNGTFAYGGLIPASLHPTVQMNDAADTQLNYSWYCKIDGEYKPIAVTTPDGKGGYTQEVWYGMNSLTIGQTYEMICDVVGKNSSDGTRWLTSVTGYTLTVTKGQAEVTKAPAAIENLTYNGEAQALVTAGEANGGEMQYSTEQNGTYSADIPTGKDAKEYTVWYKAVGDSNHEDTTPKSVEVTIAPKTVDNPTIEVASGSVYDGSEQKPTVTVKDGGNTIYQTEYTVTYANNINAGENTATVTITDNAGGNYTVSGSAKFTIAKAKVIVTAADKSAYVGSTAPDLSKPEQGRDYTVSGLFGEDKLPAAPTLRYVDETGKEIKPDMTKVGEVLIRADGEQSDNYVIVYVAGKLTVTTRPSSGGGGSSSTKTETTTNPDGSTTKTETKSDGTVTSTTTNKDGSTTKTETKKDGSSTTEVKDTSGSTGKVSTDKSGKTTASATISEKAVDTAKKSDEAVKVPTEVKAGESSASASTVKIDLPTNAGETKVEIPVKDVTSGTVAIIVKPDGTEEIVKNSVPTENGLELTVNGDVTVKIVDNAKNFEDTKGHWAQDAIDFVSARGLVNGTSDNSFSPEAPTTRAQLWTMLARKSDADLTGGATWYEKAQNWAKNSGISDGSNPNGTITRAEMVTMLWREAGSPEVSGTADFTDISADSWYAQAVAWAVKNGITTGTGSSKFDPNSTCTRAQIATFLYRSYQN